MAPGFTCCFGDEDGGDGEEDDDVEKHFNFLAAEKVTLQQEEL